MALDTSGDVGSLSMSITRVRFSSGPQRACPGRRRSLVDRRPRPRAWGCVIQWQDTSLAPMQWGFESPPVHRSPRRVSARGDDLALVVEQSGSRLQPVPTRCNSGRALSTRTARAACPRSHHLEVESSSHGECGEFDPLGSDEACPSGDRGFDMLPRYGREEGSNPSVGSSSVVRLPCLRARKRPRPPTPGSGGSTPPGGTAHAAARGRGPGLLSQGAVVRLHPAVLDSLASAHGSGPGLRIPGVVVRLHPVAPRPPRPAARTPAFHPGKDGSTPSVGTARCCGGLADPDGRRRR